jgi:hypothetical protein
MKHYFTLLFVSILFAASTQAQTFDYDFSAFSDTYTDLVNPTAATTMSWDDPLIDIPIGFSFSFEGSIGDVAYLGSSGYGAELSFENTSESGASLVAYASDIIDAGYQADEMVSIIAYQTTGTAGSRICKIEWKDVAFYNEVSDDGTNNQRISFQLWLYENSNLFEIRFGPNSITDNSVHDGNLTSGIRSFDFLTSSGYGHLAQGNPSAPTILSSTDEFEFFSVTLDDNPEDGMVYRFGASFVSVETPKENVNWNAYPNPTTGLLNLITGMDSAVQFELLDLSGRVLKNGQLFNTETLDITNFETGIYLVRMTAGSKVKTVQVVKK